jgi:hypothetical protein
MTLETPFIVEDETLYNDIARWIHIKRHKSDRTYFCASDRTFAEELINHFIEDRNWFIYEGREETVEDDRSS